MPPLIPDCLSFSLAFSKSVLFFANRPTDVLIRKVNCALEAAKASNPIYKVFRETCVAIRIYADKTESAYITSLAEHRYREITAHAKGDEKIYLAEVVDAPHTSLQHRR